MSISQLSSLVKRCALVLNETDLASQKYSKLLKAIGEAKVVMIGEASHGTHEFYNERAEITKFLIEKKGFNCVAVEGDWPDCWRINKYVKGEGESEDTERALQGFKRFPRWMWRNTVVKDFILWLRNHNDSVDLPHQKAGFYGLDLYSLFDSAYEVIKYLEKVDPEAALKARKRYGCFDTFGGDTNAYGYATSFGFSKSCQEEVTQQLIALLRKRTGELQRDAEITRGGDEDLFCAQQNARVVKDAEEYYRSMFTANTWNLRDNHMVETLDQILNHLQNSHPDKPMTKAVVWAHNSHLGDASFTDQSKTGQTNIGELVRKKYGLENTFGIGFTTYAGTVSAADGWDKPRKTKSVRPGLNNSCEELFHSIDLPFFYLIFRSNLLQKSDQVSAKQESNEEEVSISEELVTSLYKPKLQRAIGVIYKPETERQSHYFQVNISKQFDSVIHIDKTNALEPLDIKSQTEEEEPETFPFGV